MIDGYHLLKLVHVLSAAVLFGTGAGIAFFMVRARRSRDPAIAAAVGRMVVLADFLFTATAVVVQPASGIALLRLQGYAWNEPWLLASYALYGLIGMCWLPVVWIQQRMTRLAEAAAAAREPLPATYDRLYRLWFILGWPAFLGVLAVYALMIVRPAF